MQKGYIFAVTGAALWGLIGIFVNGLYEYGLSPWHVVAIRVICAAVLIGGYMLLTHPHLLRIRWQDLPLFIGTGILSVVFFNWFYFIVIDEASLSVAVVLLYSGPAFVVLLSRLIFKELLTPRKISALFVTLVGCAFVIGFFPHISISIQWHIALIGLGSGFCYALYSIFGKKASQRYSSLTITTYTFVVASLAMIPTGELWEVHHVFVEPGVWMYAIGLGLVPTVLGYILYTRGLSEIETGRASILATIEPVVALIIGIVLFGDVLTGWQFFGVILVLMAVVMVQES